MRQEIHLWTDGSCHGNPGYMGIGILLISGDLRREISKYVGKGTNNVAELTAVKEGLKAIKNKSMPLAIYTDSQYVIGIFTKGWRPKVNKKLIVAIKELLREHKRYNFNKVKAHSGISENEKVDELANNAIKDIINVA